MKQSNLFNHNNLLKVKFSDETTGLFTRALDTVLPEKMDKYKEKTIPTAGLGVTSRVINNWDKEGVITDTRNDSEKSWRKFSTFEHAYITILVALRDLGLSLEKLKQLRTSLETVVYKGITLLEASFILVNGRTNGNIYLIINKEGKCNIARKRDIIPITTSMRSLDLHIEIHLNRLWENTFDDVGVYAESVYMFSQDEIDEINKEAGKCIIKQ